MYLACVEHDFSFDVITLLIHHIHLLMELSAEILHICEWIKCLSESFFSSELLETMLCGSIEGRVPGRLEENKKATEAGAPEAAEGLGHWC